MELYSKPIITTSDDGTINIKVQPITQEYIDVRLAELAVFGQINYNIEEVVWTIQNSASQRQANKRLQSTLGVGAAEADFLLDLTIEEIANFSRENIEREIAGWNSLKNILEQCAVRDKKWEEV